MLTKPIFVIFATFLATSRATILATSALLNRVGHAAGLGGEESAHSGSPASRLLGAAAAALPLLAEGMSPSGGLRTGPLIAPPLPVPLPGALLPGPVLPVPLGGLAHAANHLRHGAEIAMHGLTHARHAMHGLAHATNAMHGLAHATNAMHGLAHATNKLHGLAHATNAMHGLAHAHNRHSLLAGAALGHHHLHIPHLG